jgi:nitrite reductase/ring-hydroxylating ferredoxin subunit
LVLEQENTGCPIRNPSSPHRRLEDPWSRVSVQGKSIALFNVEGQFFALDHTCTHRGGPLAEGEISGHDVTCPWHGARFDVRTGEVVGPPAQQAVARYGVRVTDSDLEVEM